MFLNNAEPVFHQRHVDIFFLVFLHLRFFLLLLSIVPVPYVIDTFGCHATLDVSSMSSDRLFFGGKIHLLPEVTVVFFFFRIFLWFFFVRSIRVGILNPQSE